MLWLRVAASSAPSSSWAAVTVTVRAVFQLLAVNVSAAGFAVTSALSLATAMPTPPAHPAGGLSGTMVYVPRLALVVPGSSESDRPVSLTVTPGAAVTATAFEVRTPAPWWLAAGTRTARVGWPRKSPVKARVRVAVVPPTATPETCETVRFGMALTSSNAPTPAAGAPAAKVVLVSDSARVAPFRFASVSVAGVGTMATPTSSSATVTVTLPMARVAG